jgi:hypothetical protein
MLERDTDLRAGGVGGLLRRQDRRGDGDGERCRGHMKSERSRRGSVDPRHYAVLD